MFQHKFWIIYLVLGLVILLVILSFPSEVSGEISAITLTPTQPGDPTYSFPTARPVTPAPTYDLSYFCVEFPEDWRCKDPPPPPPVYVTPTPLYPYPAPGDDADPYPAPPKKVSQPKQLVAGNCGSWDHKVESAPFKWTAPSGSIITKVIIKSGQNCFVFKQNGSDGCYRVNGIGTQTAKASRVGDPSPNCQEISHVEFFIKDKPTDTPPPRPTNTPTDQPTSTATATELPNTPTPTQSDETPTPTDATPQTPTPTDISETPGVSPTPTSDESPTPPATLPPPPKSKKKTPAVILPATGENGKADPSAIGALIGIGALGIVLLIHGLRRRPR